MRRKRLAVGMGLALCGGAAIAATVVTILAPWNVDAQAIHTFALGTRPWAVTIDAHSGRALVIDRVTDASGMPTGVGMLSTVDLTAGSVVRSVPVGPDPRAVMVDEGAGRIFVADDDDASLRVLDSRSGAMLRSITVGARPHAVAADERTGRIFVVNTGNGSVSMLDERRGAVLRTTTVATSWDSAGLAVDAERNRVYVGGPHTVSVLDARDGRMLQRIDVGGSVSGLTVDPRSGQLYVTGDTTLRVVDGPSGHVLRTVPFAGATGMTGAVAVDPARGRVFVTQAAPVDDNGVAAGAGWVNVLDARSGAFLRRVSVGVNPAAVAVDARSGRVIVVNAGGAVLRPDPWAWMPAWLRQRVPFLPQQSMAPRAVTGSISVVEPM